MYGDVFGKRRSIVAISMLYEEDKQKIAMNPMNRSSRTEVVDEG